MTKNFLMNLLLSFIWVALTGALSYSGFLFGFVLGFFVLWAMNRSEEDRRYFYRIPKAFNFVFYFLYLMLKANLQVAYEVVTPRYNFKPGIIRFPLNTETDFEINVLSTLISLTPGTLILDVSDDKKALYIHAMYLYDKESFIAELKTGLEHKLLEILR